MRILVADDVRDAAEALSILLKIEGHEVSIALGGSEAIHLIALTGRDDSASKKQAAAAGFQRYVVKPINPIEFLEIISSCALSVPQAARER